MIIPETEIEDQPPYFQVSDIFKSLNTAGLGRAPALGLWGLEKFTKYVELKCGSG
jgi:hypothetical protein